MRSHHTVQKVHIVQILFALVTSRGVGDIYALLAGGQLLNHTAQLLNASDCTGVISFKSRGSYLLFWDWSQNCDAPQSTADLRWTC